MDIYQKQNGEWKKVNDCPFPVGVIMPMAGSQDPNTIWSGTTWSKLADGTFLMADSKGGKESVKGQIPKHYHAQISDGTWNLARGGSGGTVGLAQAEGGAIYGDLMRTGDSTIATVEGVEGGTKVIPSGTIKVVMWERIA